MPRSLLQRHKHIIPLPGGVIRIIDERSKKFVSYVVFVDFFSAVAASARENSVSYRLTVLVKEKPLVVSHRTP
jgi:hypothetical protein